MLLGSSRHELRSGLLRGLPTRITASLRADLSEFRLWVLFGQPIAESVHDGQSNDEDADADEDLRSAMCCLGANMAGRGKSENEANVKSA